MKGGASVAELVDDMVLGTMNGPTFFGLPWRAMSAALTWLLVEGPPEPMISAVRSLETSFSVRPESAMACSMAM